MVSPGWVRFGSYGAVSQGGEWPGRRGELRCGKSVKVRQVEVRLVLVWQLRLGEA